jgi:hypothetical protein
LVEDNEAIDFLLDGLQILSCDFVVKTEKELKDALNVANSKDVKKELLV